MPSLQRDGRVRLSGADQVAIILSIIKNPYTPARSYALPTHIREFQSKHGGHFQYKYDRITFVVTNKRKFLYRLRLLRLRLLRRGTKK